MKHIMVGLILLMSSSLWASENLVIVTIDGLRWQEVFRGLDTRLLEHKEFTKRKSEIAEFDEPQKLMPFLHSTVAQEGVLYGNRDKQECMKLSNPWFFSYPGYNEILTGHADPDIDTNDKIPNPNVTVLEWLNQQKGFKNEVYAFGSWDVFPYIINSERSGVPVNAGFNQASGKLGAKEKFLNELQQDIPSPWATVRLDAFTHHYALETIKQHKPRVVYIAYGETDDFAHDGHYDQYILAANRTDRFIQSLWENLQSIKHYKNKTTLIITVDHGRGEEPLETWKHHASRLAMQNYMKALDTYKNGIVGSDDVWFAALGPGITHTNEELQQVDCASLNQIASTALKSLGKNWQKVNPEAGSALPIFK